MSVKVTGCRKRATEQGPLVRLTVQGTVQGKGKVRTISLVHAIQAPPKKTVTK